MQINHTPHLILISGLPGTGKSTVAKAFIERYGGRHINSDLLRNAMDMRGHYNPDDKEKVYHAMLDQTRSALLEGLKVVLDSTFVSDRIRAAFEQIARECGVPWYWVEMHASEEVIHERLNKPRPDSEADFSVYLALRDIEEPITAPHLELWSDKMTLEDMVEGIHNYTFQTSL